VSLEALATHLGILPSYLDQNGQQRVTSAETRRALLAAMGHDVGSDEAAAARLEELRDDARKELLDPVLVHERGRGRPSIPVRAPRRGGAVRWKIEIRSERGRLATREGVYDGASALTIDTPDFGIGYYDVRVFLNGARGESTSNQTLIVVPSRCVVPSDVLGEQKRMGIFANLYTLRGANWGVGDFGDLATLTHWTAEIGGSFVGLNPLHALLNRGNDTSPYGPVSRLWKNPIYLEIERVPEYQEMPEVAERLRASEVLALRESLRAAENVQYEQVWAAKSLALDLLHEAFLHRRERNATHPRVAAYNEFVAAAEPWLNRYATWMTIAETSRCWNWKEWPAALREPGSDAERRLVGQHQRRVDFHRWLQFELDRQLGEIAGMARRGGMEIGLYQDLAVGSSGTGSDAWANQRLFLSGATIGAPPDAYSDFGQNWGLPPIDPGELRRDRYRYFIRLVRGALRHAGAIRIDHVMGLFRLFWIPEGGTGRDGAYVRYPAEELLGILALESERHRALVVGEDLGIVPPEVPVAMKKWGILSSKVLYFERESGGGFKPQSCYPELALASVNTHDNPTLAGFWTGHDVSLRQELGLVDENKAAASDEREREKRELLGRLTADGALALHEHPAMDASGVPAVRRAVHRFLCESPAALVGISLDDLAGETEPVNVPGVGNDKYPCWSRKMHRTVAELAASADEALDGCSKRARQR
jgi:4-alpha-glucanotransferase